MLCWNHVYYRRRQQALESKKPQLKSQILTQIHIPNSFYSYSTETHPAPEVRTMCSLLWRTALRSKLGECRWVGCSFPLLQECYIGQCFLTSLFPHNLLHHPTRVVYRQEVTPRCHFSETKKQPPFHPGVTQCFPKPEPGIMSCILGYDLLFTTCTEPTLRSNKPIRSRCRTLA